MATKLSKQLSVKISEETWNALEAIRKIHGYTPTDVARLILETVAEHYEKKKHFAFPVVIHDAFDFDEEFAKTLVDVKPATPKATKRAG